MPPQLIAAAAQAATQKINGNITMLIGGLQALKAKKLLKNLSYPTEQMPQEVLENQTIARTMANQGLPSEQYDKAMKNIQRQQMGAVRAAGDRRGVLGALSTIQQGSNDALEGLAGLDAEKRQQNQNTLMNVNNQVAGWKSQLYDVNVRSKYNRDYDYAMQLKGAGWQNLMKGLDKRSAAIPQLLGSAGSPLGGGGTGG